jgi:hypothetical protein
MELVKISELVKIGAFLLSACSLTAGADFGIDIGSPVAAIPAGANPSGVSKVKGATFSVRTHGCSSDAKFTGSAKEAGGAEDALTFVVGGTPGSFAVVRFGRTAWLAVITADCMGTKAGAIVPVDAQGLYQRDAAKFFSHAPTAAEVNEALAKLQGGSR